MFGFGRHLVSWATIFCHFGKLALVVGNFRTGLETADGPRKLGRVGKMVVIHGLSVDLVGVATALVQVLWRFPVLRKRPVNPEAVEKPAQELRVLTGSVGPQRAAASTAAGIESHVGVYVVLVRGRWMAPTLVGGVAFGFYSVDVDAGRAAVLIGAPGAVSAGGTHAEDVHPAGQHS